MAIELDPDWPGLTVKDDASGKGGPEVNHTAIREIAGHLEEVLKKLTTPTQPPATQVATAPGAHVELPGPPPGAGSLPDLQLQCAIGEAQLGQWPTAQGFAGAVHTAYSVLVGRSAPKPRNATETPTGGASGLYAMTVQQYAAVIDSLHEIVKAYDAADQANQGSAPRAV